MNLKGILTLALLAVGLPLGGLALIWHDRCQKNVIQTVTSPDGNVVADQLVTDCGATMKIATEVQLAEKGATVPPETILLLPSSTKLPITWKDPRSLIVTVPPQAEIVDRRTDWHGVSIALDGGPLAKPKLSLPHP